MSTDHADHESRPSQSMTSSPCSTNLILSFRHGSQASPYFFNNLPSSALCSILDQISHILNSTFSSSEGGLTMMVGTCSPGATAQTSLNISDNLGFGNFSALVNALITSAFVFLINAASSDSDHQPLEARKARNRWIGLSDNQQKRFNKPLLRRPGLTDNVPFLYLLDGSILARIITCRMMSHSVRHGLYQYALFPLDRPFPSLTNSRQDREGIITINSDRI